jgi:ABC-2 type transport system permease protein
MFRALVIKEVGALFVSPIAYAVAAVFLLLSGYTFTITVIVSKQASLAHIFFQCAMQLVLLVPLLTMRQFSEERRAGTLELLLTSPAPEFHIVLAKFAAVMTVLLATIALTFSYAVVLAVHGKPDWGPVYTGYLGLILLGAALTGIGLAVSAVTASQVVAGVVSLGLFGMLWAIDSVSALLPAPVDNWFVGLSLLARFTPFAVGAMYTSDLGFFFSLILLGLFLAVRALARR